MVGRMAAAVPHWGPLRPSAPLFRLRKAQFGGVGPKRRVKLRLRPKFIVGDTIDQEKKRLQRKAKLPSKIPNHMFDHEKEYHWFSSSLQLPVNGQKRAYRIALKGLNQLSKIRRLRPSLAETCRYLEDYGVGWIVVPRGEMDLFPGMPTDTWWEITSVTKGQKDVEKVFGIPVVRGIRAMHPIEMKRITMPGYWRMFTPDSFKRLMGEREAERGVDYANITSSGCKAGVKGTSAPPHCYHTREETWMEVHQKRSQAPPARKPRWKEFTDPLDLPYWDLAKLYDDMGWSNELNATEAEVQQYKKFATNRGRRAKSSSMEGEDDGSMDEESPISLPETLSFATTPWTAAQLAQRDASRCSGLVPLDQLIGNQGSMEPKSYPDRLVRKKTRHPEVYLRSKVAKRMGTSPDSPKFQALWKKVLKSGLKLSAVQKQKKKELAA